jgi:hypothetical protein
MNVIVNNSYYIPYRFVISAPMKFNFQTEYLGIRGLAYDNNLHFLN